MLFLGNVSGHDFQFHLASWMDAAHQWREGILFPRWAEWANWGFGEPRFVFYPPASWIAGAALGSVLPWRIAPGAFIWLTLITAGMSMWVLARGRLSGPHAVVAAVLFAVNPYHLVIVYYRSDFAELLAEALLPLLVLVALRVVCEKWSHVPLLAFAFAGIWLSNVPAAVIATYSLGLALIVGCIVRRSFRPLLPGATAMIAGFCVAACYILPAATERGWVQITQALGEDLRPAQNFLFTRANDPDFVLFNWKVSWVALGVMTLSGIAAVFAARKRRDFPHLWWILVALAAIAAALMFSPSQWFWLHLPELSFVQFPWRWLEIVNLALAFFVAAAMSRYQKRWASWLAVALVFLAIGATARAMVADAWWDSADVPALATAFSLQHGYEGTDEYAPNGCDRAQLAGNPDDSTRPENVSALPAPPIGKLDPASGEEVPAAGVRIHVALWSAERRVFTAEAPAPVTLALRVVDYPAWGLRVDGQKIRAGLRPGTNQVLLSLTAGTHRVEARFRRTADRTAGDTISAFSTLILLGFVAARRRRRNTERRATPGGGA